MLLIAKDDPAVIVRYDNDDGTGFHALVAQFPRELPCQRMPIHHPHYIFQYSTNHCDVSWCDTQIVTPCHAFNTSGWEDVQRMMDSQGLLKKSFPLELIVAPDRASAELWAKWFGIGAPTIHRRLGRFIEVDRALEEYDFWRSAYNAERLDTLAKWSVEHASYQQIPIFREATHEATPAPTVAATPPDLSPPVAATATGQLMLFPAA